MKRRVHLICNAHIDPMWQWEWEEGAAETLSTFRTAAKLCEEYDAFIFNHNEALLYQWVEEYEPELFEKIRVLVKKGKWNIMGGWFLQPDCNMPSGESMIRQIKVGQDYFKEKFGVETDTAINFDSFGHSRGLVQIMAKCGYKNYFICRPTAQNKDLPDEFHWEGYDGSTVYTRRHFELYNSPLGGAAEKIDKLVKERDDCPMAILWGVGNHGGGPSRKDLNDLKTLQEALAKEDIELIHSTPEDYFAVVDKENKPKVSESLNPCNTGCYSSQVKLKQGYRKLENELFKTEKMCFAAAAKGLMEYPKELKEAERDMLFMHFHDILPGTCIKQVEDTGFRVIDHGLEIISKLRQRAYFALSRSIKYTPNGNYPILVYNPHPYPIKEVVDCEFQLVDQNWEECFTEMDVFANGKQLPAQIEKESSNLNLDWRKHVVFEAELAPSSMCLFECKPRVEYQPRTYRQLEGKFIFDGDGWQAVLDCDTGRLEKIVDGEKVLVRKNAFDLTVFSDTEDPWAMREEQDRRLGEKEGTFALLDDAESRAFSGVIDNLHCVRIIEDGDVRTVVECVYGYNISRAVQRFAFYKKQKRIDVQIKLFFQEKDKCVKLGIPVAFDGVFRGQHAFGAETLRMNGGEAVFQNWCGVVGQDCNVYVINNGTYAGSFENDTLYLTLLRTPAYTGHPILGRTILKQDRYTDRIDLGERDFTFSVRFNEEEAKVDSASLVYNQKPVAFSFFPNGDGVDTPFMQLSNDRIELVSSFVKDGKNILRLYNPDCKKQKTKLHMFAWNISADLELDGYSFKTYTVSEKGLQEASVKDL